MKYFKIYSITILIFFFILPVIYAQENNAEFNLMPIPAKTIVMQGKFRLDTLFSISVLGNPEKRIYGDATRMLRHLSGRTGIFFHQNIITDTSKSDTSNFIIDCKKPGKLSIHEEESYTLLVEPKKVYLNAETDLGAIHGLQTFIQLLKADSEGYYIPAVKIIDHPRFPWRGLMIDVSRHFMPVDVIKRNLDAMTFLKMNVLHLHLSDDQGFRVQSKIYPELTKLGSDGKYYTQAQIKNIVAYADARGIRIIPEFDIPAHTQSWFVSHPELACAPGPYFVALSWGVFNAVFNPTIPATYKFLDNLFGEMAKLFPDEYFHIGGDENNGKDWKDNKSIQAFMKKHHLTTSAALQTYFNKKIFKILTKYHKNMIGWDEILQPGMPKNIIIQSWRGRKALFAAARKGYMGILSNGYYIDLMRHASFHYLNDPIPPDSNLSNLVKKNILGGEATQWSELVTPENIDSRIWPRTAAIAERLWSPDSVRNVDDMYRRLDVINYELEDYGLTQIKNYDMMLRRLTGNNDFSALKNFVNVVEPVKGYKRQYQGIHYTSYSPYTRVVDAARPESEIDRHFKNYVDKFLRGNVELKQNITFWLNLWKENYQGLKKTIELSPILKEIKPMAINLKNISDAGLEAVRMISTGQKVDTNWINKKMELIKAAEKPYGQVELEMVPSIERLIKEVKTE
jgi:hexosaminidase